MAEVEWLSHVRKGLFGLMLYDPVNKKWGQAHVQGAFVFTSFILEHQDADHKCIDISIKTKDAADMTP